MSIGGAGAWRPFPLRLRKERPSGESQEVLRLHLRRETVPSSCTQHDELENSLRARQLLGDQPRRAAFLRIASAGAWSCGVSRDRSFETSSATSSRVAFSCSLTRGRASGRRSVRSGRAASARPVPSARAPRQLSRGRSPARLPRRAQGCRVPAPGGRSFEDCPGVDSAPLRGRAARESVRRERPALAAR